MEKIKIEQHSNAFGIWFIGWLFAIGFLQLSFFQGMLALVVWPYYIGKAVSMFVK